MIEIEVLGRERAAGAPSQQETERLCAVVAERFALSAGHLAIEFVDAERIAQLNAEYRGKPEPTDVLSFPIDGLDSLAASEVPRELGDIVICPEHTADLEEAIVHGLLHLLGMDHETDDGEMLALQDDVLAQARR